MPSRPRQVYVAADGDDVSGQGTSRRPFQSIDKAARFIRTRDWAESQSTDLYINVEPGSYYGTVTLTEDNSGGNGFDYVYRNTGDPGAAILYGAEPVDPADWEVHAGSVYKRRVAAPVTAVYENGTRSTMCRLPVLNPGVGFPTAFAPYFTTVGVNDSRTVLEYDENDFDVGDFTSPLSSFRFFCWSTILIPQADWFTDWHGATGIDIDNHRFTLDNDGMKFYAAITGGSGARYYIAGDLTMLTEPGTFTNELIDGQWWCFYIGRDGIAPEQDIIMPTAKSIVSIVGEDADNRVSHVRFEGFAATASAFNSWYRYGTDGLGAEPYDYFNTMAEFRHGGFLLENCDNVTIDSAHISNTGFCGVFMQGAVSNCTVSNSWIEHVGGDGIALNGLTPGLGDLSTGNTIYNVKVNNFGELDGSATGIRLSQSSLNTVSNWDISQGPNRAVWIQGGFGIAAADNYAYGNVVTLGNVADVCQDSGDRGAIGMSFLSAPTPPSVNAPNTFSEIIVDGVEAHASMLDVAPVGLYYDNHASGQITSNIWLLNIAPGARPPFFYNDCSGAVITNCSFLDNGDDNPSFNPALLSPDIGLTAEFPY